MPDSDIPYTNVWLPYESSPLTQLYLLYYRYLLLLSFELVNKFTYFNYTESDLRKKLSI